MSATATSDGDAAVGGRCPPAANEFRCQRPPTTTQKDVSSCTERISAVSAARLACGDRFFVAPCPTLRHRQELRATESFLLYPENLSETKVRYHAGSSGSAFGVALQLFSGNTGCVIGGVPIVSSGSGGSISGGVGGGVGGGGASVNGSVAALQLVINQVSIGSLTVGGSVSLSSSNSPVPTPTCAPILTQFKPHISASALEKIVASETSSTPTNPSVLGLMTRLRQQHRYLNRCLRNSQLFLPLSGISNYIDAAGLRSANAGAYLLTSVTPIPMLGGGSVNVGGGGGGGLGGGAGSSTTIVVGASALTLLQTLSNLRVSSTYGSGSGSGCHDFNNRIIGANGDAGPIGIAFPTGKPNNAALITTPHKDDGSSGLFGGGGGGASNGAGSSGVDATIFGAQMYPYYVTKDVVEQYIEVKSSGCEIALIDAAASNATGRKVELCSTRVPHVSRSGLGNWSTLSAGTGAAAGTNNQTITSIAIDYPLIYVGCSDGTISIVTAWCPWAPTQSSDGKYPHLTKHPWEHLLDPGAAVLRSHRSTVSITTAGTTTGIPDVVRTVPRLTLCPYAVQRKRRELLAFERRSGVRSDGVAVVDLSPGGTNNSTVGGGGGGLVAGGGGAASLMAAGGGGIALGISTPGTTISGAAAAGRQTMAATMRRGALDYYDDEAESYNTDNGGGGLAFTNFGVLDDNETDGLPTRKRQAGGRTNGTGGGVGDIDITVGASGSQVLPLGQELSNTETMISGGSGVVDGSGCNPFAPVDYYRHGSAATSQLMTSPNWEFTTVDVLNGGGHCGAVIHLSVSPEWGYLVSTSTNSTMTSQVLGPNSLATIPSSITSSSVHACTPTASSPSFYQGFTVNNLGIGLPGSDDFGSKESILRATSGTPHTEAAHIVIWDTKRRLLVRTLDLSPSSFSSVDEDALVGGVNRHHQLFLPTRTAINPKGGSIVVLGSEYSLVVPTRSSCPSNHHRSLHRQILRVYSLNGDFMASTVIQGSSSDGLAGLIPASVPVKSKKHPNPMGLLPSSVGDVKRALREMLSARNHATSPPSAALATTTVRDHHPLAWATLCLPPALLGLACNTSGNTPGAIALKHQCFGADPSPQHSTMYSENKKNPVPACSIAIALDSNDCVAHRTQSTSRAGIYKSRSRLSPSPSMSKSGGGGASLPCPKRIIVGVPQRLWSPSIPLTVSFPNAKRGGQQQPNHTSSKFPKAAVRVVYPCLPPTQSVTPISASSSILLPTPASGAQRSCLNYTRLVAVGPVILVIPDRSRRLLILDATTLECLKELKASYAHDAAATLEFPPTKIPKQNKTSKMEIGNMTKSSLDITLSPSARLSSTSTGMESITGLSNTIANAAAFNTTTTKAATTSSSSAASTTTPQAKVLSTWQQPFTASNNELMGGMWQGELVSFAVNATGTAVALVDRSGNVSTFKIQ